MTTAIATDRKAEFMLSDLFRQNDIRSMTISKGQDITGRTEISDINIRFLKEQKDTSQDYNVHFKLQTDCANICQSIEKIDTEPELTITLTQQGQTLTQEEIDKLLHSFHKTIESRIKKIQEEQSVQSIKYAGNTFILFKTTTFKVTHDDGEGHLKIEIQNKDKTTTDAKMMANDLVDGLYTGSIKLIKD